MASLYRRHRPRTFADVVGQEHVVRTLRNAIEQDKVHHAYLFVGSRGTGKTSMAKILAASLNCVNGPTVTPCGVCESCVSIANATSLDVLEMDAASNNSVDDIRDLREKVAYAPVSGRSKVYILDEAHMLTAAAWNAFLKTLEEPPPNTIFILATTEAQKILPTVADRCHRFDFQRPTMGQIASVLQRSAASEGIEVPDEAVALVARSATGSFRDALGTLEQLVAYAGRTIALDDVLAVLGAVDADLVFGTVDAVASGNARDALLAAARLTESGRDVGRFFTDLEAHLRALMIVQTLGGDVPQELRMTADADARLAEQAARVDGATVVRLLDLLAAGLRAMKDGADPRTQLELALVKAADPARDPSVKALLLRLERLERRPAAAAAPAAAAPAATQPPVVAPPTVAQPPAASQPAAGEPAAAPPAAAEQPSASPEPAADDRASTNGNHGQDPSTATPERAPAERPRRPLPDLDLPVVPARPPNAPPSTPRAPEQPATAAAQARQAEDLPPGLDRPYGEPPLPDLPTTIEVGPDDTQVTLAAASVPDTDEPAVAVAVAPVNGDLDLPSMRELWPAVLEELGGTHLGAFLAEAQPVGLHGSDLTVAFSESAAIFMKTADRAGNREVIADAVRAVTGQALRLAYELRSDSELDIEDSLAPVPEDELINRLIDEFDATIMEDTQSEETQS